MTQDEEISLLRNLLGEVLRRTVGTHGSFVTLRADLERTRPPLIITQRNDGAWITRFDVRKLHDAT